MTERKSTPKSEDPGAGKSPDPPRAEKGQKRVIALATAPAVVTALATAVMAWFTVSYVSYSKQQWKALVAANALTEANLNLTQRAFVTIGRKDGVIADFAIPKDSTQGGRKASSDLASRAGTMLSDIAATKTAAKAQPCSEQEDPGASKRKDVGHAF
jgi:hypothetical protein